MSVALVIPCYNERARLPVGEFKKFIDQPGLFFCFVDDGSRDETFEFLRQHFGSHPNAMVMRLSKNSGKAEAVRQGLLALLQEPRVKTTEWLGFWDADLATPLEEVERMLLYRTHFCPGAQAIFGSRVMRLGSDTRRSPLRHYLGRIFVTVSDLVLGLKPYDSQCGAKIFQRQLVPVVASEPFISRWIFDLEVLMRIRDHAVVEYPLVKWTDVPGSKVRIFREAFRVLRDLFLIRRKYR